MNTILYKKDAKNQLRFWSIKIDEENFRLVIEHGVVNGETQIQTEEVPYGKANRDVFEQLQSRANSRINKKVDSGYYDSVEKVNKTKPQLNALGYNKPMLAQRFDNVKNIDYENCYVQYKYDGHRCLITNDNGNIIAYSRNGKIIQTIDHILKDIRINNGETLDGELYVHNAGLNNITSLVKRVQENNIMINYICYDIITDYDLDYKVRYDIIKNESTKSNNDNFQYAPSYTNMSESEIFKMLDKAISNNYEGLILRQPDYSYEPGKRSKGLIKIKKFLEDDYKVISVKQSVEGWAILECEIGSKLFSVTAPGNVDNKFDVWFNKEKYIGKLVNVKYANITQYGIPFHPVATGFREDI